MKFYNGLIKFDGEGKIQDIVMIDDGFSFGCLFFAPLWFLFHKMWQEFFGIIISTLSILGLAEIRAAPATAVTVLTGDITLLIGFIIFLIGFKAGEITLLIGVNAGDIVLISLREFGDEEADVIHKYYLEFREKYILPLIQSKLNSEFIVLLKWTIRTQYLYSSIRYQ